jgi:hypothetical protein
MGNQIEQVALSPLVGEFYERVNRSLFRSLGESLPALVQEYGPPYLDDFERRLQILRDAFPAKPWPNWAADGYIAFNKSILKEEAGFKETGQYSAAAEDLDDVIDDVYHNPQVMERFYLVGLYCTYFLWPHHYQVLNFYRRNFVHAPAPAPQTFAEWGVGHGLLAYEALKLWDGAQAVIADLSPHSLAFSESLLRATGLWFRCRAVEGDVMTADLAPVDRLVCSELLEHVPDPVGLLSRIRECLNPGGITYLTGAINAPQPDHVFLFESAGDLLETVRKSGFIIDSHLSVCHPNRARESKPPTVLALVARRGD